MQRTLHVDTIVSTLSKRCRELCVSTPFLSIVVKIFHDRNEISRFWKFTNRFLNLHRGDNNNRELEVNLGPNGSLMLPTSTEFEGLENLTLKHLTVSIVPLDLVIEDVKGFPLGDIYTKVSAEISPCGA
ncbi:hypothetical protein FEM48_Zijuj05G0025800 [Ziziphus jujuba var. spinosa]|uniref:Uncharacterized protein n=1 Tax=Ziziphus jujuba var. spinosa TaxID=714518 RepID=A0A978VCB4_ZIZJJ|nr:hypothetical protein FEM48_Zijuj05G0025800 [Ziziphus jujuba var. spinosa]